MPEAGALDAVAVTGTRDDPRLRRAFVAALDAGEIQAVYQPVVDPVSGLMGALEALARWRFEGVDVPPSTFVPICVAAGRSEQLSALMLERACGQLAEWNAGLGHRRLRMAVNVDLRQRRAVPRRAVPGSPATWACAPSRRGWSDRGSCASSPGWAATSCRATSSRGPRPPRS